MQKTIILHSQAVLYHTPISELHTVVVKESVDIILTDPPYPKEFLPQWGELAEFAAYALKPGGHLLAMSGHCWIPEVMNTLEAQPELRYNWMLAMGPLTQGSHTNLGRRISRSYWKPILWHIKPPSSVHQQLKDWVPVDAKDKRYHHWGQGGGEWVAILDQLKLPKHRTVVCDPFVGGGTTAVVCAELGYPFIGADIDQTCIQTTTERLNSRQMTLL